MYQATCILTALINSGSSVLVPIAGIMTPLQARSFLLNSSSLVLLAVFAATWASTAQASRTPQAASAHSQSPRVIRAELLHRDHPNSPLAPAANGTTLAALADRVAAGCRRSDERVRQVAERRRLADFNTPVELKGGFAGEYVMTIEFGTPPQTFTGLVDTGSDLVWIQCVPCPGCSSFTQPGPLYNPDASSSDVYVACTDLQCADFTGAPANCDANTNNTCRINYGYADGSQIEGTLTTETLTLTDTTSVTGFIMGCMNNNTGIFDNYDGIIGFGRGKYSLPSQFGTLDYLQVFAYCLVPYTATTTLASPLLFGTSDPANARGLVYTPLLAFGDTNYYVNMTGISVNGQPLDLARSLFKADAAGVLFDSGNPITRFFPEVYLPLQAAIASFINTTYPVVPDDTHYCFNVTGVQSLVLPSVTFHYGGVDGVSVVDFNLGPENVFGPYTGVEGVTCLAFRTTTSDDMSIGSVSQANHYIETDVVNMRMGWISEDCTKA